MLKPWPIVLAGTAAFVAAGIAAAVLDSQESVAGVSVHSGLPPAAEAAARDGAPILVVFGAEWCAPCQALKKNTLTNTAFTEKAGPLHLVQIDVDVDRESARLFRVRSVPSLFLVTSEMKVVSRRQGFLLPQELLRWVQEGRRRISRGIWEGTEFQEEAGTFNPSEATEEDWRKMVENLGASDPAVRRRAALALEGGRENSVPHLMRAMLDPYLGVRIGAAELMRRLAPGSPAVDPWASREMLEKQVEEVRGWWKGAGKLPDPLAGSELEPAEARSVGEAILQILEEDPILRTEAMSFLAQMGMPVLPQLREAIEKRAAAGDQKAIWLLDDVRWAILVPDLLEQRMGVRRDLARGGSEERQLAAQRLGSGGTSALPALRELAQDVDPLVRESTIHALSRIKTKESLAVLSILLEDRDSNLRMIAAQELGKSKSPWAAGYLREAVGDPDEVVACVAIGALEEVKAVSHGAVLVSCLGDPRWRVRATAAEVIGKLKIRTAMDSLIELWDDPDAFVVKSAVEALYTMGFEPSEEQFQSLLSLIQRLPDLTKPITRLVMRKDTAESLGKVESIFQGVAASQRHGILEVLETRRNTREADDSHWKPILERVAASEDASLRRRLADLLGERSIRLTAEFLSSLLGDPDAGVRSAAAGQLLRAAAHHWGVFGRKNDQDFGILEIHKPEENSETAGGDENIISEEHPSKEETVILVPESQEKKRSSLKRLVDRIFGRREVEEEELVEFSVDLEISPPGTSPRSKEESRERAREIRGLYNSWHGILGDHLGENPSLREALAYFVSGDGKAGLPVLEATMERKDLELPSSAESTFAFGVFLWRLPWPQGKEVIIRASRSVGLYSRMVAAGEHAAEGVRQYLGEPGRIVHALEKAGDEDRHILLGTLFRQASESTGEISPWPIHADVLEALGHSESDFARAAGVLSIGHRRDDLPAAFLERGLNDPSPWVRRAAVQLHILRDLPLEDRERKLGPLLPDPSLDVAVLAAYGILDRYWWNQADLGSLFFYFQFEDFRQSHYHSLSISNRNSPRDPVPRKPDFLEGVHGRLQEKEAQAHSVAPAVFSLLLAQYGDYRGLHLELDRWKSDRKQSVPKLLLLGLRITKDSRYLAPFRVELASAKTEGSLRFLQTLLEDVGGQEAMALKSEINRRILELEN